jgi:hypothetical protein
MELFPAFRSSSVVDPPTFKRSADCFCLRVVLVYVDNAWTIPIISELEACSITCPWSTWFNCHHDEQKISTLRQSFVISSFGLKWALQLWTPLQNSDYDEVELHTFLFYFPFWMRNIKIISAALQRLSQHQGCHLFGLLLVVSCMADSSLFFCQIINQNQNDSCALLDRCLYFMEGPFFNSSLDVFYLFWCKETSNL